MARDQMYARSLLEVTKCTKDLVVPPEPDMNAVKCFQKHAGKPISQIPLVTAVKKGLSKIMEAKDSNGLGLEPEHV